MDNDICKVCGKGPFSRLDTHLRQSHSMSREEYDAQYASVELDDLDFEEMEPSIEKAEEPKVEEKTEVSHNDIQKEIFKGVSESKYPRDLDGFLAYFNIEEKDLISLVKRFTDGKSIDVTKSIKNSYKAAKSAADVLVKKDTSGEIQTTSVFTAETLEKEYGYKTIAVKSNPKRWILKKS